MSTGNFEKQDKIVMEEFSDYLKKENLSQKTIKSHMGNLGFFYTYLTYYDESNSFAKMDFVDVGGFLGDFFPRKAMWASPSSVKSNISTFKKFFKFMVKSNHIPENEYDDLLSLIKSEKEDWIESVEFDEDELDY